MKRIGIYGGTFDPIHIGHLVLAEQCREQCRLDEVWFVPAGAPPHKTAAEISPGRQRMEMLELATAGHERFRIKTLELDRPGLSFTVETLQTIRDQESQAELFLLLGADSLRDLPGWREPERILQLARVVAVNRGGATLDLTAVIQVLGEQSRERVIPAVMPGIEIASREIRERVRAGKTIRYLVPRAVEVYIAQQGLYASQETAD
ncbi:MAG: nicotinate-nucleotide adenylyltransferase [Planctomycetaceae bacterium]